MGSGVLLRERGRGGRGDDPEIHRKSTVGRPWGKLQDHRAHRALKPALSREPSRRLQPQTGDFQSQSNPPAFSRWSFSIGLVVLGRTMVAHSACTRRAWTTPHMVAFAAADSNSCFYRVKVAPNLPAIDSKVVINRKSREARYSWRYLLPNCYQVSNQWA